MKMKNSFIIEEIRKSCLSKIKETTLPWQKTLNLIIELGTNNPDINIFGYCLELVNASDPNKIWNIDLQNLKTLKILKNLRKIEYYEPGLHPLNDLI